MEEVGVLTTHTERIGSVFPSPGACNEYIHLFYCPIQGNVHVASTAGLESENEDIKTHRISSSEFVRMAMHHEILDAKTLLCAYWFKDRFEL
jgi:ADP-ribose pyrophosphatase